MLMLLQTPLKMTPNNFTELFSVSLDGTTQSVNYSQIAALDWNQTWSISIWWKASSISGSDNYIWGQNDAGVSSSIRLAVTSTLVYTYYVKAGADRNCTFAAITTTGVWYNAIVTNDGSGLSAGTILYHNGSAAIQAGGIVQTTGSAVSGTFDIGRPGAYTGGFRWAGLLDEASYWNVVLTPTDVTNIYNSGTPTNLATHAKAANLVSWWRFENNLTDTKGVNNGTGVGTPTFSSDVP